MNAVDLYEKYFGGKELTLVDGRLCEVGDGNLLAPIFTTPAVKVGHLVAKEETASFSNIVTCRYRLTEVRDPFWMALFSFFQRSGYSVHIEECGMLRITTFSGLISTALSVAKNCVSLSNSTYRHFRTIAEKEARQQDRERGIANFKDDQLVSDQESGKSDIA